MPSGRINKSLNIFYLANPSVDMDFSKSLFLNFYEIVLLLLFIRLLFIDIIYDRVLLGYLCSTFFLDSEN